MTQPKKIKATYKNGVIEPIEKLNLPDGQELEVVFTVLSSVTPELSEEEKKELIREMGGSMKGTWGSTVEEIETYLNSDRESWNKAF